MKIISEEHQKTNKTIQCKTISKRISKKNNNEYKQYENTIRRISKD